MIIYLPPDAAKHLRDVIGVKITQLEDFCKIEIDSEMPGVIVDIFYRGAEYGAEEYHKVVKANYGNSIVLNKFGKN